MLQDFDRAYGLRYFNAAGADLEAKLGERHDPETHLIPLILQAASGRRPEITLFERDYATPDGTCIRDCRALRKRAAASQAPPSPRPFGLPPALPTSRRRRSDSAGTEPYAGTVPCPASSPSRIGTSCGRKRGEGEPQGR